MEEQETYLEEEQFNPKVTYVIYGDKSAGKTSIALSFPGTILAISFDHKTVPIKHYFFNDKKLDFKENGEHRIKVYDGVQGYDKSFANITKSAYDCIVRIDKFLRNIVDNCPEDKLPDYIFIDGVEELYKMAEMYMRKIEGLKPTQGTANQNVWKRRTYTMDSIHRLCTLCSKKGIIYSTYTEQKELIKDGAIIQKKEIPKWMGDLMKETDVVIKAVKTFNDKTGQNFYAYVESSKYPVLKPGESILMTNRRIQLGDL